MRHTVPPFAVCPRCRVWVPPQLPLNYATPCCPVCRADLTRPPIPCQVGMYDAPPNDTLTDPATTPEQKPPNGLLCSKPYKQV